MATADHHDDHHGISHVASVKVLVGTGGTLLFLTLVTVLATKVDFGASINLAIAMAIAVVKATLVVLFFMHLKLSAGLTLTPVKLRHLGTELCHETLKEMQGFLSSRLDIRLRTTIKTIAVEEGVVNAIETDRGERISCRYLILAPGREGAEWLCNEAERLKLSLDSNPVDVGCRIEVPMATMEKLTRTLYESKLEFYSRSFNDRVRTFCMCPGGEVIMESTGGSDPVITVNGIGYAQPHTRNTNFAILVSTTFTEPFHEPLAYGKYLERLANILSGGVLVQRLGDLMDGRRGIYFRHETPR